MIAPGVIGDILKMLILGNIDCTQCGRTTYFEIVFENNLRMYDCASLEEKVGANWNVNARTC